MPMLRDRIGRPAQLLAGAMELFARQPDWPAWGTGEITTYLGA